MSEKSVRNGAILYCTLGTCKSQLTISQVHNELTNGVGQAVISDNLVGVNISNFCNCTRSSPPQPCMPSIVLKWQLANKKHLIDGEVALLDNCILPCLNGGIIKIEKNS